MRVPYLYLNEPLDEIYMVGLTGPLTGSFNERIGLGMQVAHVAPPHFKRIFRTLLSRGMRSCSAFCVDDETHYSLESCLLPT